MDLLLWGALLRLTQSLLQATPFIVTGLFVTGVLRRLMGSAHTRQLFGADSWRSLPQAWAIGMLLPVCSLGVIPVCREMRRSGISGGTILAFALTAPLFNPLSLLYGLTLSQPITILVFALCSLVVVTAGGALWDWLFPGTSATPPDEPAPAFGLRRMLAIFVVAARESVGWSAFYMSVGLLGVAVLSLFLPPGYLQKTMGPENTWAPLLMVAVSLPAYATPMLAMSQLGSMFQHANSIGAAFVLLTFGAGMNVGLAAWTWGTYGMRRTLTWFSLLIAVVLALSYGIDRPLAPRDVEPADHTHAFDVYCQPFHSSQINPAEAVWNKLRQDVQPYELVSALVLAVLMLTGVVLRWTDRPHAVPSRTWESWLLAVSSTPGEAGVPARAGRFDLILPAWVLGGVALLGLVALSVLGCYAFYPPPSEALEELRLCKTDALSAALSSHSREAEHWLAVADDWTRKLEVGVYLRRGSLSPYHRMKARVLRDKLELVEHSLADGELEARRKYVAQAERAYQRMKVAFLEEL